MLCGHAEARQTLARRSRPWPGTWRPPDAWTRGWRGYAGGPGRRLAAARAGEM